MIVTQGYDNTQRITTCGLGGTPAVPPAVDGQLVTQGYDNSQRIVTCGLGGTLAVPAVTTPASIIGGFVPDLYSELDDAAEIVLMMYWNYRRRKA